MTANPDWDVVVVGGGPAGCAAAIHAVGKGLRTALLERNSFPRHRPGESLHPGVEPILDMLQVGEAVDAAGFLRYSGVWRDSNGQRTFLAFGEDDAGVWRGYQAWRAEFDHLLLEQARSVGVKVFQPCVPERVLLDAGRVMGVAGRAGPFSARYVIDASGRSHWLARRLRLDLVTKSPRLIAWYGYLRPQGDSDEWKAPIFVSDAREWSWVTLVKPDLLLWTRLSLDADHRLDHPPPPAAVRHFPVVERCAGADVSWRIAESVSGPGYFLVGDAASVLDPASSHGVLRGLISGIKAADSASRVCGGDTSAQQAESEFNQWMQKWHGDELRQLAQSYAAQAGCPRWVKQLADAPPALETAFQRSFA